MSYRFTNTEKWSDAWFSGLKQIEMLLFMYLCDNCDIAGFIEVNYRRWSNDLGSSQETIQGALKGLQRGLIFSKEGDCIYIKNFLRHQKNLPLNQNNKAHIGIMKRFVLYAEKFDIQDVNEFIEGASKGLQSPTGNGIGSILHEDTNKGGENEKTWKNDYETYLSELNHAYELFIADEKTIKEQKEFNPNLDIKLTVKKAVTNFWSKQGGWKNKKQSGSKSIDWKSTFVNSLSQPQNKVYLPKDQMTPTIKPIVKLNESWQN